VVWLGADFVREAAASEPDDATLADRAIWLARAGALSYLDDVRAGREDGPMALIAEQLRMAFASG